MKLRESKVKLRVEVNDCEIKGRSESTMKLRVGKFKGITDFELKLRTFKGRNATPLFRKFEVSDGKFSIFP